MASSNAQRLANKKYKEKAFDSISFVVHKGKREEYKAAAARRGLGHAEMIRLAIEEYLQNHPPVQTN